MNILAKRKDIMFNFLKNTNLTIFSLILLILKLINIILFFYLISLLGMPCRDFERCNAILPCVDQSAQDQHKHTTDNENCSPFCTCTCCGSQVYTYPSFNYFDNKFYTQSNKVTEIYQFSFPSDFCSNIWQPPKIG